MQLLHITEPQLHLNFLASLQSLQPAIIKHFLIHVSFLLLSNFIVNGLSVCSNDSKNKSGGSSHMKPLSYFSEPQVSHGVILIYSAHKTSCSCLINLTPVKIALQMLQGYVFCVSNLIFSSKRSVSCLCSKQVIAPLSKT